jgi:hypothetical protein
MSRWNRPVYDITNGRPHLRVENRVLHELQVLGTLAGQRNPAVPGVSRRLVPTWHAQTELDNLTPAPTAGR